MLDDAVAVRRVGELQPQNLSIFLGLLQTVARGLIGRFRFENCNGEVSAISLQVIRPLLRATNCSVTNEYNPAVGKALLLADLVVFPSGAVELWQDVSTAGIGFVQGHCIPVAVAFSELELLEMRGFRCQLVLLTIVRSLDALTISART